MLPSSHKHAAEFRRCLTDLDVVQMRKLWQHVAPDMPQPASDREVLATLHSARTRSESITFALRAYSHRWLTDQELPSGLPDNLRPPAERLYPKTVGAVGLSVNFSSAWLKPAGEIISRAMRDAIMHEYSFDRVPDPVVVKRAMFAARDSVTKGLF